jgi:hypothetical protein
MFTLQLNVVKTNGKFNFIQVVPSEIMAYEAYTLLDLK